MAAGKGDLDQLALLIPEITKAPKGDRFTFKLKTAGTLADNKVWKTVLFKELIRASTALEVKAQESIDYNITSPIWGWTAGRTTSRVNGQQVTSPRDIVDTGNLRSKVKLKSEFLVSGLKLTASNTAPYAALVEFGGYIMAGSGPDRRRVLLPARPYIAASFGLYNQTAGVSVVDYRSVLQKALDTALANYASIKGN